MSCCPMGECRLWSTRWTATLVTRPLCTTRGGHRSSSTILSVRQVYQPLKPVQVPVKPVYAPAKPVYNTVKPDYNPFHPVPLLLTPAYSKPAPVKTSFSNYKPVHQYQTAFSHLQPTFVQFHENTIPNHPSYNHIYDTLSISSPYILPQAPKPPAQYRPQSYIPAPVQNHRPIHNLLVRPSSHHIILKNPHVKPLSPPEHKRHPKNLKPDPFLVSEEELKGRDFSDPFWYPLERKIVKGYRKEEKGSHDHDQVQP